MCKVATITIQLRNYLATCATCAARSIVDPPPAIFSHFAAYKFPFALANTAHCIFVVVAHLIFFVVANSIIFLLSLLMLLL